MKKLILFFIIHIVCTHYLVAQNPVDWHAYMQLRANTSFEDEYNISLRRMKFWLNSTPDFSQQWSYKVQAVFVSSRQEILFLQDVFAQYQSKNGNHALRFGQFTPRYSLQWTQGDYLIPTMERALSINTLVPDGTMGVRDLGIQYTKYFLNKNLRMDFGLFKGRGVSDLNIKEKGFLLTQNSSYKFKIHQSKLKVGYSVLFRKAYNLPLKKILPDSILFSGDDFRFGLYGLYQSKYVNFQAEYLTVYLNGENTNGYYALAAIKINPKNRVYFSYDSYYDLIESTENSPWLRSGYSYFINDYKMMITLQSSFQQCMGQWKNETILQFQLFLH